MGGLDEFKQLVDQAPDGVVILEAGRVVFMNETAARLLGVRADEAIGTPIGNYLPPADAAATAERIGRMMATGIPMAPNEYGTLANPDRTVEIKSIPWQWQGRRAVLAFARDVTERKALQQQLMHAGRLAAVGTLAAGVAHEINNPLQYMELSVYELASALASLPNVPDELRTLLAHVEHGIDRIASITRGLRTFSRPRNSSAPGPTDAAAAVERALRMVANDLRHRAALIRDYAEVPAIIANAGELEQVLVNLLLNAIQALAGKPDDTITITLATAADRVTLGIKDTGIGMTDDVRARVFDPFFTTKPIGAGMGLGLSVSKGLVEAMGGELVLASTPGQGTLATITLRAHRAPLAEATPPPEFAQPMTRRRVLVVDDEPLVRDTLGMLLDDHHEVILVADGPAALAAAREHAFDAILCDVMMPGMHGVDVYRQLASEHPGLERRIVFITGGAFVPELADFVATTGNRVLEKPFQANQVLGAIEAICR
jgi:PAS domain S-box-containing protein